MSINNSSNHPHFGCRTYCEPTVKNLIKRKVSEKGARAWVIKHVDSYKKLMPGASHHERAKMAVGFANTEKDGRTLDSFALTARSEAIMNGQSNERPSYVQKDVFNNMLGLIERM